VVPSLGAHSDVVRQNAEAPFAATSTRVDRHRRDRDHRYPGMAGDPHPDCIRDAERATIDDRLVTYLLNPAHERGQHKARVFNALGYTATNSHELTAHLRSQLPTVPAAFRKENGWGGENWEARIELPTSSGTVSLRTFWELRPGTPPKFLTAHPPKRSRQEQQR
jgi:hypothetical protein